MTLDGEIPTTADAVAASVAVARRLGLPSDDPVVVADGYSVRVHLRPSPVLTRVPASSRGMRGDPLPWLERELAVARWLSDYGAPVVGPTREADPGVHVAGGLPLTLWTYTPHDPDALVEDRALGGVLGELHRALASYPGELPVLLGARTDIEAGLAVAREPGRVDPRYAELFLSAEAVLRPARDPPADMLRPVHGDVHTGNLLMTRTGPLWTDLEDVCAGPLEWDLASATVTDGVLEHYDDEVDPDRRDRYRDVRRLQVLAAVLCQDGPWNAPWMPALARGLRARLQG